MNGFPMGERMPADFPRMHMGMPMGMGMNPPLSEPAEASGGMPNCSAPPEPQAESSPAAAPAAATAAAQTEVPEAKSQEQERIPPDQIPRFMFNPERMRMFAGAHPGMVPPAAFMFAGRGPAFAPFGGIPMMPGRHPRGGRVGVVVETPSEETKVKDRKSESEESPAPSCPCMEKKSDNAGDSSDEDSGVGEPFSSSSSSESEQKEKPSDSSEEESSSEEELLIPPEVADWCKHQLRKKYFRHMCKAYTVYYTRLTMLLEYYTYQNWHYMNGGYMMPPMPPMMPPMTSMFMPQPFYGQHHPHHHHHHHQPPPPPPSGQRFPWMFHNGF